VALALYQNFILLFCLRYAHVETKNDELDQIWEAIEKNPTWITGVLYNEVLKWKIVKLELVHKIEKKVKSTNELIASLIKGLCLKPRTEPSKFISASFKNSTMKEESMTTLADLKSEFLKELIFIVKREKDRKK